MQKVLKSVTVTLLALVLLTSFSACSNSAENDYYLEINDLASSFKDVSNNMQTSKITTQEGYNDFVSSIEEMLGYIDKMAELEAPEKYADVQEQFKSARDKWKESLEIYKSVDDITAEDTSTKMAEALTLYQEAEKLLKDAAKLADEIYNS